jgi:hypothetical protein
MELHGSVGLGGRNLKSDVKRIQQMLAKAHMAPGPDDSRCGRLTIQAIERFQAGFMHRPDGRIDVNGRTWHRLEQQSAHAATPHATPSHVATPRAAVPQLSGVRIVPSVVRPQITAARSAAAPSPVAATPVAAPPVDTEARTASRYWRTRTPLVAYSQVNRGLSCPTSSQMTNLLGDPHDKSAQGKLHTSYVGPIHATGREEALTSLASILERVKKDLPDLYKVLGTQGMYVLRNIRGRSCYSNHSWGTAIDVTVDGLLVPLGSSSSCKGLDALVPYFNDAGWYWGGGYHHRKDCMHFECGLAMVQGFKK